QRRSVRWQTGCGTWLLPLRRKPDLDAVAGSDGQQLLDLFPGRGQGGRCTFGQLHADLEEHLFNTGRRNRNQHLGRLAAFVLEQVERSDRHVGESPGAGNEAVIADLEGDLALKDVEALLLSAVDVRGRSAARSGGCFKQGVLAAGVLACGQESVNIA